MKLSLDRRDIGVDQVIEQAGLLRVHLLAALGVLEPLELRDLVGQLLDEGFVVMDFLAHRLDRFAEGIDCLAQRIHLFDRGCRHAALTCAASARSLRVSGGQDRGAKSCR